MVKYFCDFCKKNSKTESIELPTLECRGIGFLQ